ncbi:MAG: hypothetical protein H7222_15780 [Methylotenera sp.]|nr:hypothetical protein [Oligoflexia bacterium]
MKKYIEVLEFKPTQFAVGLLEVHTKVKEIEKLKKSKRKKLVDEHPIPVIISPHNEYFLVDHHHLLFAFWSVGIKEAKIEVLHDLSEKKMSFSQFWRWMKKRGYFYPYCQFGEGPRHPLYLPLDIRGVADDPYRSLAWFVRQEGAYENTQENFAEFTWANFYREKKLLDHHGKKGMEHALERAVKLAKSKEAKRLPGYIERKTVKESAKTDTKKK